MTRKLWRSLSHFNNWLAVIITKGVGTMWCAYAFTALYLAGQFRDEWRDAINAFSSSYYQGVMLPIIMVGSAVLTAALDRRARRDHDTLMAQFRMLQAMMEKQEETLSAIRKLAATDQRLEKQLKALAPDQTKS